MKRGSFPARSLQTLSDDHARFLSHGHGDIKLAKHYNNVIGSVIFDIPLENVSIVDIMIFFLSFTLIILIIGVYTRTAPLLRHLQPPVAASGGELQRAQFHSCHE